jgi:hypothetical protein
MLDLALFRTPAFAGAQITAFAISSSIFAMFLYLTLYLQNVLGYSPFEAGLRFLPVSLMAFALAPLAGKLSAQVPVRLLLGSGLALVGAGLVLSHGLDASSRWTALLPGFIVGGAGIGITNPPLASTAVSVVPPERSGMASGVNNTFRQVGIATGIAALGAIFQHRIQASLVATLTGGPLADRAPELSKALASGSAASVLHSVPQGLRPQVVDASRIAFVDALNVLFLVAAGTAFVGAVLAFTLVRGRDVRLAPEGAAAESA